jgi:hypothetical protein
MFNLETAIAEWRRQMIAAGIKTPVPLEELENHLREEIERQIKCSTDEEQAFKLAVERIGQGGKLREEFAKVEDVARMKKRALLRRLCVVAGVAIVYCQLAVVWYLGARAGSMQISGMDIALALGAAAPLILLGWAGPYIAELLPVIREGWVIAITLALLFLVALLFRIVFPAISPVNFVHLQIVFLWVLSPTMGFGSCASAWFDRCAAIRKKSYQYV